MDADGLIQARHGDPLVGSVNSGDLLSLESVGDEPIGVVHEIGVVPRIRRAHEHSGHDDNIGLNGQDGIPQDSVAAPVDSPPAAARRTRTLLRSRSPGYR